MLLRLSSIICCFILFGCGNADGYIELEPGAKFKLVEPGDEDLAPAIGQYISYRISVYDANDELIYFTNKRGVDKDEYLLYTHDNSGVIQRNLNRFNEGDSVSFKFNQASFIEQFPFVRLNSKQDLYRVEFRVNYIEDAAERANRLHALGSHAVLKEDGDIVDFITSRKDSLVFKEWNGMYIHLVKKGDVKVKKGSKMILKYTAYFLSGEEFDNSIDGDKLYFTFGDEGQVIEGLKLLASHLGIGSVSKVVIPSKLAFGDGGSTGKVIPPSTPLYYHLKIQEVLDTISSISPV